MGCRDSPQVTPIVTVRSETHSTMEQKLIRRLLHRPVSEIEAVENLLGGIRVSGDRKRHERLSVESSRKLS
ncbi:hypothetical protein L1987_10968 [Smallanthus sonchifolius]|uniref:Uncharacterized protein n=1 Tax=Smallanthus sonchifolius TaxID=185202 RepID=A0ACB9J9M4_9ASTR|nr:hypothetical protein L1987_10968 [Smallanthus sonchifolius]